MRKFLGRKKDKDKGGSDDGARASHASAAAQGRPKPPLPSGPKPLRIPTTPAPMPPMDEAELMLMGAAAQANAMSTPRSPRLGDAAAPKRPKPPPPAGPPPGYTGKPTPPPPPKDMVAGRAPPAAAELMAEVIEPPRLQSSPSAFEQFQAMKKLVRSFVIASPEARKHRRKDSLRAADQLEKDSLRDATTSRPSRQFGRSRRTRGETDASGAHRTEDSAGPASSSAANRSTTSLHGLVQAISQASSKARSSFSGRSSLRLSMTSPRQSNRSVADRSRRQTGMPTLSSVESIREQAQPGE